MLLGYLLGEAHADQQQEEEEGVPGCRRKGCYKSNDGGGFYHRSLDQLN